MRLSNGAKGLVFIGLAVTACEQILDLPNREGPPGIASCTDTGDCECVAGRGNCNDDWSDGCEVDLASSAEHCGACGRTCGGGTCIDQECDCPADFATCGSEPDCTTHLLTDTAHCGDCLTACSADSVCQGGACACDLASDPGATALSDPGGDQDLVFAMRVLDFGDGDPDSEAHIGYDLDDDCTECSCASPLSNACKAPAWQTQPIQDGPGGIDNAASQLFGYAAVVDPTNSSETISNDADDGVWTLLIRVQDYDGQANDGAVSVAMYVSLGFAKDPCNGAETVPAWDGTDRWSVSVATLKGQGQGGSACGERGDFDLDMPGFPAEGAYVQDGLLVANWVSDIELVLDSLTIRLAQSVLTAQLDGERLTGGVFAGRWTLSESFRTIASLSVGGKAMCTDHTAYPLLKNTLCGRADLFDGIPTPTATCDSISFAFAFEAQAAQFGTVLSIPQQPPTCPPETNPENDDCSDLAP